MAFHNKMRDVPREAGAMDGRAGGGARFLIGTLMLIVALVITVATFTFTATGHAPPPQSRVKLRISPAHRRRQFSLPAAPKRNPWLVGRHRFS